MLDQFGDELQHFSGGDPLAPRSKVSFVLCQKKTRRRGRLEATRTGGTNRDHAAMATRRDWKLGPNGCREASWSKECLVAA